MKCFTFVLLTLLGASTHLAAQVFVEPSLADVKNAGLIACKQYYTEAALIIGDHPRSHPISDRMLDSLIREHPRSSYLSDTMLGSLPKLKFTITQPKLGKQVGGSWVAAVVCELSGLLADGRAVTEVIKEPLGLKFRVQVYDDGIDDPRIAVEKGSIERRDVN